MLPTADEEDGSTTGEIETSVTRMFPSEAATASVATSLGGIATIATSVTFAIAHRSSSPITSEKNCLAAHQPTEELLVQVRSVVGCERLPSERIVVERR